MAFNKWVWNMQAVGYNGAEFIYLYLHIFIALFWVHHDAPQPWKHAWITTPKILFSPHPGGLFPIWRKESKQGPFLFNADEKVGLRIRNSFLLKETAYHQTHPIECRFPHRFFSHQSWGQRMAPLESTLWPFFL